MINLTNGEILKCPCNACGGETNHYVIATHVKSGREVLDDDTGYDISWSDTWKMIECCGCEAVKLKKSHWFSEADDLEIIYFPAATARDLPIWHNQLSEDMKSLLMEVYTALNADGRRLAIMGARTLIDMVMVDKVGDVGNFKEKMNALYESGVVSAANREFLEAALEAGNAAAHRGHAAGPDEVNNVMDIVENLLQAVYVLPKSTTALWASTPARPPTKKHRKDQK